MTNRPLVVLTLAYVAGILAARLLMEDTFLAYLLFSALVVAGVGAWLWRLVSVTSFMAAVPLAAFASGGAAFWFASSASEGDLVRYAGEEAKLTGTVVEEPQYGEDYVSYRLQVETVDVGNGQEYARGKVQVRVYHYNRWAEDEDWAGAEGDETSEGGTLRGGSDKGHWYGERLLLEGELLEPRGQRNPGGFDYRFYLRTQGVSALMYLQSHEVNSLGEGDVNWLASSAFSLRSRMVESIEKSLPSPHGELLSAILFGQRDYLPQEVQNNFQRAGVGHLMAVSGLHVGLVAAMILGLWKVLRLRGAASIILAVVLIFGYAYLTGMRPAALRAALMLSMGLVALLLGRQKDFPSAISAAGLVTLIYNPLLLFTVGFQLSYAATLSIFYVYPFLEKELLLRFPNYLRQLVAVTVAAQIGVLPLTAHYFGSLPIMGLIFNIMLLPIITFIVGLGLVGCLLYLVSPLLASILHIANFPLLSYVIGVSSLAEVPWVHLDVASPGLAGLVAYFGILVLGMVAYYRYRGSPGSQEDTNLRDEASQVYDEVSPVHNEASSVHIEVSPLHKLKGYLGGNLRGKAVIAALLVAILLVWSGFGGNLRPQMNVYFIDVGQGAAAYLETGCGFNMMVDAGGELPFQEPEEMGGVGENIVVPFLQHKGVSELDLVVISHPHEDHFAGMLAVMEHIPIELLMISPVPGETRLYEDMLEDARTREIPVLEARAGDSFSLGRHASMEVILPPADALYKGTNCDLNNNSIVNRITFGDIDFLFTGDIEEEAASDLLRRQVDISADVLLIPHHGGYFESVTPFLEAVSPHLAVLQVGRNPFGHPHPAIIDALSDEGINTLRNDKHGAVIIHTDGTELWLETMQEAG